MVDEARDEAGPVRITVRIVLAYLVRNHVRPGDLPDLIRNVHAALRGLGAPAPEGAAEPVKATASQIRRSVRPDYLVSFEDGRPYKSLRRHLATRGLSPEAYRQKWGLPADYPMVAAGYSAQRSALARSFGLGRGRAAQAGAVTEATGVADAGEEADEVDAITRAPFEEDGPRGEA